MSEQKDSLLKQILRVTAELPLEVVEQLRLAIEKADPSVMEEGWVSIVNDVSPDQYRHQAKRLFDAWKLTSEITPQTVSMALSTAVALERLHREKQKAELVWTGPDTKTIPARHTEQALLQVIDSAHQRITLVSYAVYKIPRICEALVRAADRGVLLRIIIEESEKKDGEKAYDNLRALGRSVASRSSVFLWPLEKRTKDNSGKQGILHVKCAVADSHTLLLSSANLTEYAFTVNMELGVLITGGILPGKVEKHFSKLIEEGILVAP